MNKLKEMSIEEREEYKREQNRKNQRTYMSNPDNRDKHNIWRANKIMGDKDILPKKKKKNKIISKPKISVLLNCVICGNPYEKRGPKKTCSDQCSKKLQYVNWLKWVKNNPGKHREQAKESYKRTHRNGNSPIKKGRIKTNE
jgi:hypothetical protein